MRSCISMLCLLGLAVAAGAQDRDADPERDKWLEGLRSARSGLRLEEWRPESNFVVSKTAVPRAMFPAVDVHNHLVFEGDRKTIAARVREMDAANVRTVVSLTGTRGEGLRRNIEELAERYPGRFIVCTQVDYRDIDDPAFLQRAARQLEKDYKVGARCLKILKELGLYLKDRSGRYVPVNDRRLDPVWAKAGEIGIPVMIHVGDPIAFFRPWDARNESYQGLLRRPQWWFYGEDHVGVKRFTHEELMTQRNEVVERHPKTTFVGLHYASLSHDLRAVGALLDRYPNLSVEMGARNWALGKVPHSGRKFAIKYQDRILFGTDAGVSAKMYETWFRTLETDDDLVTSRSSPWAPIHGLSLPDEVLEKIYNGNAKKIFPSLR